MFQPPTDNLYKFMAIVGTVILLASLGFLWKKVEEFDSRTTQATTQGTFARQLHYQLLKPLNDLKPIRGTRHCPRGIIVDVDSEIGRYLIENGEKREDLIKENNRLKSEPCNERDEQIKHEIRVEEARKKFEASFTEKDRQNIAELDFTKKWLRYYAWAAGMLSSLGIILSLTGFWLWYSRVQRYQDVEIKIKAQPKPKFSWK